MEDFGRFEEMELELLPFCRFTWQFTKSFRDSISYQAGGLFTVLGSRCWTVMY